ncbi:uncharacterized protein LOC142337169 [Convolutriloba macropyga]|uniref:uncharacterized protein LOC142337169 n=1 Tax=Convolutriloba macropyga TaxID=536237 RepID=UPI003F51EF89
MDLNLSGFYMFIACLIMSRADLEESYWESQLFVVPSHWTRLSRQCSRYSDVFCLHGYIYDRSRQGRQLDASEVDKFTQLVEKVFLRNNWFALPPNQIRMCCDDQVDQYERRAYRKGVTAHEFATKATDFSLTTHKHLNWLYVRYVPYLCSNLISEVGFGYGPLRIRGDFQTAPFIYPVKLGAEWIRFNAENLTSFLTFDWFREEIVCGKNTWICDDYDNHLQDGPLDLLSSDDSNDVTSRDSFRLRRD